VWEATYILLGTLRITDTPMGGGDGVHAVGPGTLVLRIESRDAPAAPRVELRSLTLAEDFTVESKAMLWSATVVTHAIAGATRDATGAIARGSIAGDILRWSGPIHAFRTDALLRCAGSLCGRFGAPPEGRSEIHEPPQDVQFSSFRFDKSGQTFQTVAPALVSHSESAGQKTFLALSGRAKSWVCITPKVGAQRE
jgi:hypothetical protein